MKTVKKNWRPKDWSNPYMPKASSQIKTEHQVIFEAGADAMLEAIISGGIKSPSYIDIYKYLR